MKKMPLHAQAGHLFQEGIFTLQNYFYKLLRNIISIGSVQKMYGHLKNKQLVRVRRQLSKDSCHL